MRLKNISESYDSHGLDHDCRTIKQAIKDKNTKVFNTGRNLLFRVPVGASDEYKSTIVELVDKLVYFNSVDFTYDGVADGWMELCEEIMTGFNMKQHLAWPSLWFITKNGIPYSTDKKFRMLKVEDAQKIVDELNAIADSEMLV